MYLTVFNLKTSPIKEHRQTPKEQHVKDVVVDLGLLSYSSVFLSTAGFHWLTTEMESNSFINDQWY